MENSRNVNEEKRGNPRVQKLFMIAYLPKGDGPSRTPISLGRTVDISPSGVGMEVYKELAVGTVMEMEIDLDDLPVPAWGKVVRADPLGNGNYLIGIRFDDNQEMLQAKIAGAELSVLRHRTFELERVMQVLVRTGWPWDADGKPNEILRNCTEDYAAAMLEARELLGRDHRIMSSWSEKGG